MSNFAETNLEKVIDLLGEMEKFIGSHDIVVTKPNVQWWNQESGGRANILEN